MTFGSEALEELKVIKDECKQHFHLSTQGEGNHMLTHNTLFRQWGTFTSLFTFFHVSLNSSTIL